MADKKLLHIGVCTIRNEEQLIERWANMVHFFCERVVALIDPETHDHTIQILKDKCPFVEIVYQDRNLGDSDDDHEGPTHTLIMHVNKTKWIQENIPDGEWFLEIAADEVFEEKDYPKLIEEINFAKTMGLDAITHHNLYEPILVDLGQIVLKDRWYYDPNREPTGKISDQFGIVWDQDFTLNHTRFHCKNAGYIHNNQPHSGFKNNAKNPLNSSVPLWHYHRLKYGVITASNWRDALGSIYRLTKKHENLVPIVPLCGDHNKNNPEHISSRSIKTEIIQKLKQQYKGDLGAVVFGYELPNGLKIFPQNTPSFLNFTPPLNLVHFISPRTHELEPYGIIKDLIEISLSKVVVFTLYALPIVSAPLFHPEPYNQKDYTEFQAFFKGKSESKLRVEFFTPFKKKLMIVGWLGRDQEMCYLANKLKQTWDVITIATDILKEGNKVHPTPTASVFDILTGKPREQCLKFDKAFPMEIFYNRYKPDLIYIRQTDVALDWKGCDPVPKIFHCSEGMWPDWPLNVNHVIGFIYSFYGIVDTYKNCHRWEMRHVKEKLFLPYFYPPEQYPPVPPQADREYKYEFGFMGSSGIEGEEYTWDDPRGDVYEMHVRDWRRRFILYAQKELGLTVYQRSTYISRSDAEYSEFAKDCNLFINVSSPWGAVNQRQYHIPAMGPVLVQWRYKGIEELGFKDWENCLLFSDESELKAKVLWAREHPHELQIIRENGFLLAMRNTDQIRANTVSIWLYQLLSKYPCKGGINQ